METKIINRKGATVRDSFLIIIVGVFLFGAMFSYISINADDLGIAVPTRYNDSFNLMKEDRGKLNSTITEIKVGLTGITEAPSGTYGLFGLLGILKIFSLPIILIDTASHSIAAATGILDFIPNELITAISIGITIIIVFVLIAMFTQRFKEP